MQRRETTMDGSKGRPCRRLRRGLTMPELLVAVAVLGLLGFLVLARRSSAPMMTAISAPAPPPAPPQPWTAGGEMSLQETLDRLGFTVNVPSTYQGRPLRNLRGYQAST